MRYHICKIANDHWTYYFKSSLRSRYHHQLAKRPWIASYISPFFSPITLSTTNFPIILCLNTSIHFHDFKRNTKTSQKWRVQSLAIYKFPKLSFQNIYQKNRWTREKGMLRQFLTKGAMQDIRYRNGFGTPWYCWCDKLLEWGY